MRNEETLAIMRNMGLLSKLHRTTAEKELNQSGLYRSQMMVLSFLARSSEPVSQKEIAERFEISKPSVTEMLKRLEELGMIARTTPKDDLRVKLISLTPRGRAVAEENRESFLKMNSRMAEGIAEEDMEVFSRVLRKMTENLRALEAEQNA